MQVAYSSQGKLLEKLPENLRAEILREAEEITAPVDSYIIKQCQKGHHVFYLLEGRVKIGVFLPGGTEKTLIILEPKNLFGEVAAFDQNAYPISAVALQHCRLLKWPTELLREYLAKHRHIAQSIISSIAQKLSILATQVESLSTVTARKRVADLFVHLADVYGESSVQGQRISLRLTQQELANLAGVSRVSVSNSYRYLKALGLVSKYRGRYYVRDVRALRLEGSGVGDTSRLSDEELLPGQTGTT